MPTALELAFAALTFGLVVGGMIGWCLGAWRNRISYPQEDQIHGDASLMGREW